MSSHLFSMLRQAFFACPLMYSAAVKASENRQVCYVIGASSIMSAVLPAPGEIGFYHYAQPNLREHLNDKYEEPTTG